MSCSKTNGVCYNASTEYNNVSVSTDPVNRDAIVIESTMTLPEDDLFDTAIIIDSDEQMIITDTVDTSEIITHKSDQATIMTLGTHDLQGISVASMSVINATTSRLCLQFTLVDGATTDTVHVALECNIRPTEIMSYTNDNQLVFNGCIDTVANLWRLKGCDGPLGDNVTCPNPAITTTIEIPHDATSTVSPVPTSTGIYTTTIPTAHASSPGTVDIIVPNMSLYSIVSSNTPTIPTADNRGWVSGVVGGIVVIMITLMIVVLGMSYYCIMFYTACTLFRNVPVKMQV